jgi:prephenate dehydratase
MKTMLEEARDYADSSAQNAGQASDSQNRTYQLHNETAVIFSQSSAVYNNMTLLAKEIQANSDNIRTWMNEKTP